MISNKGSRGWGRKEEESVEEDLAASPKKTKKEKKVLKSAAEAYDYSLNLLNFRDYSEAELEQRLMRQGASKDDAKSTVAKLVEYGLVKEDRYAERVYNSWLQKRYYGKSHLAAELQKRLLKPELQLQVLENFNSELELEHAQAAAQLFIERNHKKLEGLAEAEPKEKQKLLAAGARFMASRGFSARYMAVLMEKLYKYNDM